MFLHRKHPLKLHPGHSGTKNKRTSQRAGPTASTNRRKELDPGQRSVCEAAGAGKLLSDGRGRQGVVGEIWARRVPVGGSSGPLVQVTPGCSAGRSPGHGAVLSAPGRA